MPNKGQVGYGSGQSDLVGESPVHCKGLILSDLKGPFKPRSFSDSMITLDKNSHLVFVAKNLSSFGLQLAKLHLLD